LYLMIFFIVESDSSFFVVVNLTNELFIFNRKIGADQRV
jgi:hypothetical protein